MDVVQTILNHPSWANFPAEPVEPVFRMNERQCPLKACGRVRNAPCAVLSREGRGLVLFTTARYNDAAFLGNVGFALALSRLGVAYIFSAYNFPKETRLFRPTFGSGHVQLNLLNTSGTNLALQIVAEWRNEAGLSRSAVKTFNSPFNGRTLVNNLPLYLDLRGKGVCDISLKNTEMGVSQKIAEYAFDNRPFLEVIPPDYRGMISTARRDRAVHFSVDVNPFTTQRTKGMEVSVQITNAQGAWLGSDRQVVLSDGAQSLDFAVQIPDATPAGDYTIHAECLREGSFKEVARSPFRIVPVRPGQMFVDQDGVLLSEGKPFYPLGVYHAHIGHLEDDVAGLATNKYGAKGWHDMGFNMAQIWNWDYYANATTNAVHLDIYGGANAKTNRAAVIKRNTAVIQRLQELGIHFLLEDNPARELVVRNRTPWKKIYDWETDENGIRCRREATRNSDGLLAGWYLCDEISGEAFAPEINRLAEHYHAFDEDHFVYNLGMMNSTGLDCAFSADVPGCEFYPCRNGETNSPLAQGMILYDAFRARVKGRRPVPVVHQTFGEGNVRLDQLRAMTYLSFAHAADGIFWYCWKETGDWNGTRQQGMGWWPNTYKLVCNLVAEGKVFSPALLEKQTHRLMRSSDGRIHALLCGNETTGRFLIYVNGEYEPSDSELALPELGTAKLAPLFGGKPKASWRDGRLHLKVSALETGAFLIGHDPTRPRPDRYISKTPDWAK